MNQSPMPLSWLKDTVRDLRDYHGYKMPMKECYAIALDHWLLG